MRCRRREFEGCANAPCTRGKKMHVSNIYCNDVQFYLQLTNISSGSLKLFFFSLLMVVCWWREHLEVMALDLTVSVFWVFVGCWWCFVFQNLWFPRCWHSCETEAIKIWWSHKWSVVSPAIEPSTTEGFHFLICIFPRNCVVYTVFIFRFSIVPSLLRTQLNWFQGVEGDVTPSWADLDAQGSCLGLCPHQLDTERHWEGWEVFYCLQELWADNAQRWPSASLNFSAEGEIGDTAPPPANTSIITQRLNRANISRYHLHTWVQTHVLKDFAHLRHFPPSSPGYE